jgi:hypothetical protein
MSRNLTRLDIRINVFDKEGQRAQVLPGLTPPELVQAILDEFRELEYLGGPPSDYQIYRMNDHNPLNEDLPLEQQIGHADHLVLVEKEQPLPARTDRPAHALYLRDQVTGEVYKLHWLPAIIGRPDPGQPHEDWLAVDLRSHEGGLRVSRRHAMISTDGQHYYIETLSKNPTFLEGGEDAQAIPMDESVRLESGDLIRLSRSKITLKFIVLNQE